jgi:hypothetical protein
MSHEGPLFGLRTYIYARHFSWLDLMPIWSSADAYGFGSPMPLMYHKLFYYLAGALLLLTGSIKTANLVAVALLLVLGAIGLFITMRTLGASRLASLVAGCSLITANYTVTNWLVRGALAEFSAAMVVPWVFLFFVRAVRDGRLSVPLGVSIGLLWLSHSVLALFTAWLLAAAFFILATARLAPWSVLNPRTAWPALLAFTCFLAPYLLPMLILDDPYQFTRILSVPFQPIYQFRPALVYIWEPYWRFGSTAKGLMVQFDHPMLTLLAVGLFSLVRGGWPPSQPAGDRQPVSEVLRPTLALLIVAAIGTLLQLRVSSFFYEWMPGAAFIQFPWRLLAVVTPALIATAVYVADRTVAGDTRPFLLGGALAWMIVGCGAFEPLRDGRIALEPKLAGMTFSGFREYEPALAAPVTEIRMRIAARWTEAGCTHTRLDPDDEVRTARFETSCGRAAALPLPLYASVLHQVSSTTQQRHQRCLNLPQFAAVCGAVIPAGDSVLTVEMPTMASIPGWVWDRLRGRTQD